MISIGLFAMTSTITQPEKKWITHKTVDSKWYEAKNYLVMSAFQFHDTSPYLIKNGHVQSWTKGPVWQNKTFSTFMYQGKHADYMQINFFLLIKEKKTELSKKKKGNFNITFVYSCVFQRADALLCRVLNGSNLNWYKYPYTKQTEISSVLSNMIIVILLLNLKSKKRLKTLLWVVWTKQWDNQSVTNYFYLSIDQLIHQLLK